MGRGEAGSAKWRRQCCAILGRVTQDGSGQGGARRVRSWALRVLSGGDRAGWAGRKRAGWGGVMFGESGRRGAGLGWVGLGWDGIKQGEVEQGGTGQISETLSTTKSRRMAQQKIPNCCSKITFFCIAVNSLVDPAIHSSNRSLFGPRYDNMRHNRTGKAAHFLKFPAALNTFPEPTRVHERSRTRG